MIKRKICILLMFLVFSIPTVVFSDTGLQINKGESYVFANNSTDVQTITMSSGAIYDYAIYKANGESSGFEMNYSRSYESGQSIPAGGKLVITAITNMTTHFGGAITSALDPEAALIKVVLQGGENHTFTNTSGSSQSLEISAGGTYDYAIYKANGESNGFEMNYSRSYESGQSIPAGGKLVITAITNMNAYFGNGHVITSALNSEAALIKVTIQAGENRIFTSTSSSSLSLEISAGGTYDYALYKANGESNGFEMNYSRSYVAGHSIPAGGKLVITAITNMTAYFDNAHAITSALNSEAALIKVTIQAGENRIFTSTSSSSLSLEISAGGTYDYALYKANGESNGFEMNYSRSYESGHSIPAGGKLAVTAITNMTAYFDNAHAITSALNSEAALIKVTIQAGENRIFTSTSSSSKSLEISAGGTYDYALYKSNGESNGFEMNYSRSYESGQYIPAGGKLLITAITNMTAYFDNVHVITSALNSEATLIKVPLQVGEDHIFTNTGSSSQSVEISAGATFDYALYKANGESNGAEINYSRSYETEHSIPAGGKLVITAKSNMIAFEPNHFINATSSSTEPALVKVGVSKFKFESKPIDQIQAPPKAVQPKSDAFIIKAETPFQKQEKLTIQIDPEKLQKIDKKKVAIWHFVSDTKTSSTSNKQHPVHIASLSGHWESIGGKVSDDLTSVSSYISEDGTYAVMLSDQTIADIQGYKYQYEIEVLLAQGIISGYNENEFRPNSQISRAEFAIVVVKGAHIPMTRGGSSFRDVSESHWASRYVAGAVQAGAIKGYNSESFGPSDSITREQAVAIIQRTGRLNSLSETEVTSSLSALQDGDKVSDYARKAVAEALKENMINEEDGNVFSPQSDANRGVVAKMIMVLLEKLGYL